MTLAAHILDRILRDPRLAYYFDPLTASMELLTEQYALENGLDLGTFRNEYYGKLKFENPHCADCLKEL